MSGVVVRPMLPEDLPAVMEIDRYCFLTPWSAESFEAELECSVAYYRVAELDGELAGYIGSNLILDEGHVTTFGVRPDLRRRGIGERLLADLLAHAVRTGCRRITLEVRASNVAAQELYRKYGFAAVSRRPRYYYDDDEDAVVMWIEDTSRLGFREMLETRLSALGSTPTP